MNIFLFQRDLRITDNNALNHIIKSNILFFPVYIFDFDKNKKLYNKKTINFLLQSLSDLNNKLKKYKLKLYYLDNVKDLKNMNINQIYLNANYSPYYIYRTNILQQNYNCNIYEDDCFLNEYNFYLKHDKTPYSVYGAYLKNAKTN